MIQLRRAYHLLTDSDSHTEVSPRDAVYLVRAKEEERSRVARDLHDVVGQKLDMLLIELAQVQKMAVLEPELVQRLTSLRNQVREISSDINCISHNLHLTRLDQLGLEASLRGMCREFEAPGKLKIDIHLDGDLSKLPEDVNLSVYRIAQEAVRNCAKHSGAGSVCLVLVRTDNELQLSVSDDGHGFDTSSRAVQEGLGFTSMHERARIVGGSISINSRTGHGTIVKVLIGLKSEDSKSTEIGTNVWDLRRSFGLGLSER